MPKTELKVALLRHTPQPDEIVALGARICYSPSTLDDLREGVEKKDQQGFISGLMDMGHFSPIEHASFTFGIEGVSRSLLAQITRHRIASFSVQSQRYVKAAQDFDYVIPPAIEALGAEAVEEYARQMKTIGEFYAYWSDKLGGKGESVNEDARFVLPQAAATRMLVTMNARELMHFFSLRCCNRAQWEIRALAWEMLRHALTAAPAIFGEAGPSCLRGACAEGKKTCGKAAEVRERQALLRQEVEKHEE